jgi:hypothetical protein
LIFENAVALPRLTQACDLKRKEQLNIKYSIKSDMFRTVFDVMPLLIFVVDDDVRIQEYNATSADFLALQRSFFSADMWPNQRNHSSFV